MNEMNKKACPKCGTVNNHDGQYCVKCGADLEWKNQNNQSEIERNLYLCIQQLTRDVHFLKTVVLVYVVLSIIGAIYLMSSLKI